MNTGLTSTIIHEPRQSRLTDQRKRGWTVPNGLLRQYFPKRTDLSIHTPEDLRAVQERLNHRPRKVLGWRTPMEVFGCALAG
jgi:hypothetical protein